MGCYNSIIAEKGGDNLIEEIHADERPLGLYIFSDDLYAENKIINNTDSGGAGINCTALQGAIP